MNFELNDWETRFLIEACRVLHRQWLAVAQETADEGERADYSNDIGQLEVLQHRLETDAQETFGADVTVFSRDGV